MPEGPESHTIASKLRPNLVNLFLIEVKVNTPTVQQDLRLLSLPLKVLEVYARGKRVLFVMERGIFVTFLGMTGRWTWSLTEGVMPHLSFTFSRTSDSGLDEEVRVLHYLDVRKFGMVSYYIEYVPFQKYFSSIGPDMLSEPPTFEKYLQTMREVCEKRAKRGNKVLTLTGWLLDQKYYSGVGNYLKSEILYFARLDPHRGINQLTDEEVFRMYQCTLDVMKLSYFNGGLTISDYWSPDGNPGTYQCMIYMRAGQRDVHGFEIKSYKDDGRTTFWVPELQH